MSSGIEAPHRRTSNCTLVTMVRHAARMACHHHACHHDRERLLATVVELCTATGVIAALELALPLIFHHCCVELAQPVPHDCWHNVAAVSALSTTLIGRAYTVLAKLASSGGLAFAGVALEYREH